MVDSIDDKNWSKDKYIQNFSAILNYLEKNDGMDVAEIKDLYHKEVEEKKHNPTYQKWGELSIKDPGPTIETKLTKLIEKEKYDEFSKDAGPGNSTHLQAMKYFKVKVLNAVLGQQFQMARSKMGNKLGK